VTSDQDPRNIQPPSPSSAPVVNGERLVKAGTSSDTAPPNFRFSSGRENRSGVEESHYMKGKEMVAGATALKLLDTALADKL
jgi:hypothetical protein